VGAGVAVSTVEPLPNAEDVRRLSKQLESVEAQLKTTNAKLDKALAALRPDEKPASKRLVRFEHEDGVAALDPKVVRAVEDSPDGKTVIRCGVGGGPAFAYRVNYAVADVLSMLAPDEEGTDVDV
jgi:hypothetical protein